jgi:hypothetical protein
MRRWLPSGLIMGKLEEVEDSYKKRLADRERKE